MYHVKNLASEKLRNLPGVGLQHICIMSLQRSPGMEGGGGALASGLPLRGTNDKPLHSAGAGSAITVAITACGGGAV